MYLLRGCAQAAAAVTLAILLMLQPSIGHTSSHPSNINDKSYVVVKELHYDYEIGDADAGTDSPPPLAVGTVMLAKELRSSPTDDSLMRVRFVTTDGEKGWVDYRTLQDRSALQLFSRTDSYLRNLVAKKRKADAGGDILHANEKQTAINVDVRSGDSEQTKTQLELFLKNLGLDRYFNTLVSQAVHSTDDLKLIEDEVELQELGVESSFHRKKLLKAIKAEL